MNAIQWKFSGRQVLGFLLSLAVLFSCSKKKSDHEPDDPSDTELQVTSINPTQGAPGTIVTITGKNFSTTPQNNRVYFEQSVLASEVTNATTNELRVKVPIDAQTGRIEIRVGNQVVTSTQAFTVEPEPSSITSFAPTEGPFGTEVTITGRKLGEDIKVLINGIEANIKSRSSTEIVFTIPANTTLTSHVLIVVSDGNSLQTTDKFTVTASGPYGHWEDKQVEFTPGAGVFTNGLSFVYDNKIYWGFTGISFAEDHADYVIFDPAQPSNGWVLQNQPPADMAPARLQHAIALVHNNKVYIGTGLTPDATNTWWQFHPETNTSTRLADFPVVTAGALGFVV